MALLPNLITPAEADTYLPVEVYPEWHALPDDTIKEAYIRNASTYVRLNWSCANEDFDTPDLSDDAQRGVALYSEADRAGNLYSGVSVTPDSGVSGEVVQETLKAGSLEKTLKYSESVGVNSEDALKQAGDVFLLLGCTPKSSSGSCSGELVRT